MRLRDSGDHSRNTEAKGFAVDDGSRLTDKNKDKKKFPIGNAGKLCPGYIKTTKMIKKSRKKSVKGCNASRIMHKKAGTPTRKPDLLMAAPTTTTKGSSLKLHSKRMAETPAV
jgi:hypothetical protein